MKGNLKKILFLFLFFVFLILSIICLVIDELSIALFMGLFTFFSLILLIKTFSSNKSQESIFKSEVYDILKTYDPILIEVDSIPNLENKNLVKTLSFKDIVNLEYEFRKPVYYVHNEESYDFILINKDDAYTYTTKLDSEKNSLLDAYLDSLNPTESTTGDLDIIDSLDKTTVIRLDENKEYLVSPVRDTKEEIKSKENTSNKEKKGNFKDKNTTDETISEDTQTIEMQS